LIKTFLENTVVGDGMVVQSEHAVLMGILRLADLLYHPSDRKQSRTGLMVTSFFVKSFPDEFGRKR